ncbi:MAG TPA: protein kinase [Polyangiaceae bacterium]|nr:protein kinase [Polyangiaceae bacterium]
MSLSTPLALEGAILDRKYRLIRIVAEGGFAVVYRGEHLGLAVPIAVKVLKVPVAGASDRLIERFGLEARTIARLKHPDIVQVLDTGFHSSAEHPDGAPYLVLEWLSGETLKQDLAVRRGRGGRAPSECLRLLAPIFSALGHAHAHGIAHRDVKPSNILLARTESGVSAKLLDFGIAKAMEADASPPDATATDGTQRVFSKSHAAPEQFAGARTGPWTDLHALGLLLTELLTDEPPYPSSDGVELGRLAFAPERPTPARAGLDVGPWEAVIARALALRPEDRGKSADELYRALERSVAAADRAHAASAQRRRTEAQSPEPSGDAGTERSATYSRATELTAPAPRSRAPRLAVVAVAAALGVFGVVRFGSRAASSSEHGAPAEHPAPRTETAAPTEPAVAFEPEAPAASTRMAPEALGPDTASSAASAAPATRHGERRGGRPLAPKSTAPAAASSAPASSARAPLPYVLE